jgi:CRP-like cAMP-binding protein
MDPLIPYLRQFGSLSDDVAACLTDNLQHKSCKKGTHLVVPGQIPQELYFVRQGVQMSYFISEKKTHVIAFTYPPNVCTIPGAFTFQTPASYYLSCLSDSELAYLPMTVLTALLDSCPSLERLFRRLTEAVLAGLIQRHIERHALSMEDRFKTCCQRTPELLQLVPHKFLASYLDIDRSNFSKLFNRVRL